MVIKILRKKPEVHALLTGMFVLAGMAMPANALPGRPAYHALPIARAFGGSEDAYQGSQANTQALTNLKENVNEATGGFTVSLGLLSIKGYLPLHLSLTYSAGYRAGVPGMLGLPEGWAYSLDYMLPGKSITYNGTTHIIDPFWQDDSGYRSGLKYLNQHGVAFVDDTSKTLPQSYRYPHYEYYYRYVLSFPDGSHDYFDAVGKLVARDDRFGNHIVYAYANPNADVFHTVLVSIRDSLGQTFRLSQQSGQLALTWMDSLKRPHTQKIYYDDTGIRTYINPLGDRTKLTYITRRGVHLIACIDYPGGLETTLDYQDLPFKWSEKGPTGSLPVVKEIIHTDLAQKKVVSDVFYSGYHESNYTGYPYYPLGKSSDNLLENNRKISYRYHVDKIVMMSDGKKLRTETIYNTESQPVEIAVYLPSDRAGIPTYRTLLHYKLDPDRHARTVNYDKPVEVDNQVFDTKTHGYLTLVKTMMHYDVYGSVSAAEQYSYQPLLRKLVEITRTTNTYASFYHLPLSQTTLLWQPLRSTWKRMETDNTLTADHKAIATETSAMNGQAWKKRSYTYDAHGIRRSSTLSWMDQGHHGVDQVKTHMDYQYDLGHHRETVITTDPLGDASRSIIDTTTNNVLQTITPRGESTRYSYDLVGRPLSITSPEEEKSTFAYTDYQHDGINSILATSPLGLKRKTQVDAFGRVVRLWENTNPTDPAALVLQSVTGYNKAGKVSVRQDMFGNTTTYTYNALGAVTSVQDAYQNKTQIDYDYSALSKTIWLNGIRQTTIVSDPARATVKTIVYPNSHNPHQVSYEQISLARYDGGHHLVKTTHLIHNPGTDQTTVLNSTVFDYDPDYQNIREKKTQGHTTVTLSHEVDLLGDLLSESKQINTDKVIQRDQYQYNQAGERIREVWPNGSVINYDYNADGLLDNEVLPDGTRIAIEHDHDGRETKRSWSGSHGQSHQLLSSYNADGVLVSMQLDQRKEKFTYATSGALLRHAYCSDPDCHQPKQVVYTYNTYGQQISESDVHGQVTHDAYTRQGQLRSIQGPHDTVVYSYTRPDAPGENKHYGELAGTDVVGLYRTKMVKDAFGRPSTMEKTAASGKGMLSISYHYNTLDFLTGMEVRSARYPNNTDLNYVVHEAYDDLGRLISEHRTTGKSGQEVMHYTYDDNNNLLTDTKNGVVTSYHYNDLDQLTSYKKAGKSFYPVYDRNGRETSNGAGWKYQYNALGQLIEARSADDNDSIRYTYYPGGLRSGRTSSHAGGTTRYYYQGTTINAVDDPRDGQISYLLAGNTRVGGYRETAQGELSSLYYFNDNKSTVLTMEKTRKAPWVFHGSTHYAPYGGHRNTLGTGVATNFSYDGEYQDPATGLVYLRARDYDPDSKRFLVMDSRHVWNKYSFADANPVMNIDPSGHNAMSAVNYVIDSLALIGSIAVLAVDQPEVLPVVSSKLFTAAAATGAGAGVAGITSQALVDAHAVSANSSVARGLSITSTALAVPGLLVTVLDAGAFIAAKLSSEAAELGSTVAGSTEEAAELCSSMEASVEEVPDALFVIPTVPSAIEMKYVLNGVPNRYVGERVIKTWNEFYGEFYSPYAGAKLFTNTMVGFPRIPYDLVISRENIGEVLRGDLVDAYFSFVVKRTSIMYRLGRNPFINFTANQKVLLQWGPHGEVRFFQTGFGSNSMRLPRELFIESWRAYSAEILTMLSDIRGFYPNFNRLRRSYYPVDPGRELTWIFWLDLDNSHE